jgi:hypothetical protein
MRARRLSDLGFARTRAIAALTNRRGRDAPRPPNNGDAIARAVAALYDPRLVWPNGPEGDRFPTD